MSSHRELKAAPLFFVLLFWIAVMFGTMYIRRSPNPLIANDRCWYIMLLLAGAVMIQWTTTKLMPARYFREAQPVYNPTLTPLQSTAIVFSYLGAIVIIGGIAWIAGKWLPKYIMEVLPTVIVAGFGCLIPAYWRWVSGLGRSTATPE